MGKRFSKNTLTLALLLVSTMLSAQKSFDLQTNESNFSLAEKSLIGYQSSFDFSVEEVKKGWWRYARQFGSPLDMRTHYQVKIPAESTDGNVDLFIYSETFASDGKVQFRLGLENQKYKKQAKELLRDFKKDMYIQYYLGEIKLLEIEAEKLSRNYESAISKEEESSALSGLNQKKVETEKLKEKIREIEQH